MLNQKSCMDFAINAGPLERFVPAHKFGFKYNVWRLVNSQGFEYFILFLITVNTVILMLKWYEYINEKEGEHNKVDDIEECHLHAIAR